MAEGRHSFIAFYPSDWLAGTARMARMHRSVYFDICCYIWDTNEPCPKSELPLMFGDIDGWERYVDDLVTAKKLTRNRDGSLSNAKAHAEARKAFDLWEKKSKGGKVGAEKTNNPKEKRKAPDRTPADTPGGSSPKMAGSPAAEPEPEPEPDSEEEDRDSPTTPVDSDLETEAKMRSFAARFGRAGGVAVFPNRANHFAQQLDVIREWVTMGLDPDTEIIPALEQDVIDNPGDRHSLKYFTPMMARIAARKDATANGKHPKSGRTGARPVDGFTAALRDVAGRQA